MWKITRKTQSPNSDNEVRFLVGKEYIVGRKDCSILIKEDPSISRKHATLSVQHDIANLGDVSKIPELTLTDSSKYGTSVNGTKITQSTKLKHGDEIYFGTHSSIYRVSYNPLIAVTSCLDNTKKKLVKKQIHSLGGHLVNEWKTGHITHLVMEGLVFTIKVIHALAECCNIVTSSFFDETIKAIETKQTPTTPKMFLPPLKEESIKSDEPLFVPDEKRKTLFEGKTFYFLSQKQFKRTHEAIEMCSGETVLLDLTSNLQNDSRLVRNDSCIMMMDQKERDGLSTHHQELVSQLMDLLRCNNKRPIPESELGLAILQMNLKNYCNPNIDAVPAITQNIVCQSLNVALDEMSQVYSPQQKQHSQQFKRPSMSVDHNGSKSKTVPQAERKTTQSTITTMFTPKQQDKQTTNTERKTSATETPEHAMKSDKPKQPQPITPIPDTLNISDEGNVFVADTPAKKSPKSSTSLFFASTKSNVSLAVPGSLSFEKQPSKDGFVKTSSWSRELRSDQRSTEDDVTVVKNSKKTLGIRVSDSEVFDEDENESKATGIRYKGNTSNGNKQIEILPESTRFSVSENEWEPEPKVKNAEKCQPSSRNGNVDNTVKQVKQAKPVIPDSLALDSETNDFSNMQASKRDMAGQIVKDAIPDSVGFDESHNVGFGKSSKETSNENYTPTTSTKRRKESEPNNDAKRLKQIDDSFQELRSENYPPTMSKRGEKTQDFYATRSDSGDEETSLILETNAVRSYSKRRRMTEDEDGYEIQHNTLPAKRVRNDKTEKHEPDLENDGAEIHESELEIHGLDRRINRKEENGKNGGPISPRNRSDGFLLSRKVGVVKTSHQESIKPAKVVFDGDNQEDFNEDDLPSNLVVVDVVSLVVRKPRQKSAAQETRNEHAEKNFKKFKKQWYAGCDRRFPKIIGGSDLVVHQALSHVEHEDWFLDAREANREQERRDRMEQELFMSDVGLPQRRKRH